MPSRSYRQHCAVAAALDAVGERWSLLVVRELLDGPRRYSDLLAGLPGIATDVLAARLRRLEAEGVVARRTLEPPAGARVYELTPAGRDLEPLMVELARWGLHRLGPRPADGTTFQSRWISVTLRGLFRPDRVGARELAATLEIDGDPVTVRIGDGELAVRPGRAAEATVTVRGSLDAFLDVARGAAGPPPFDGRLDVVGPPDDVMALTHAFGLDAPAHRGLRTPR